MTEILQSSHRNRRPLLKSVAAVGLLIFGLGCAKSAPREFTFAITQVDLGEIVAGECVELRFPFVVGQQDCVITQLTPSCGCLNPRIELIPGQPSDVGATLAASSAGEIVVDFNTASFFGPKIVHLEVKGSGPGLPIQLTVSADLKPYFLIQPQQIRFGPIDPRRPHSKSLIVSATTPFKIERVMGLAEGCELSGLDSQTSQLSHKLELTIPAGSVEQRQAMFLKFFADNGLQFIVPVSWELGGDLWVRPDRLLPLGPLTAGVPVQATIDLGASRGRLATPKWRFEGISGVTADCLTLEEPNTYRLRLSLSGDFPVGPLQGDVVLEIAHEIDGQIETRDWPVKLVGLVRPAPNSSPKR